MKHVLRQFTHSPGFSALAVLILAIGIGANVAMFSLVHALLLRPLPVDRPAELVSVYNGDKVRKDLYRGVSYPNYLDLRGQVRSLSGLAAFTIAMVGVADGADTRRVFATLVSANYFAVLGAPPALGRAFRPEDEDPTTAARSIILSHSYWQRSGADPNILGQLLKLNGHSFTIVGVAREKFTGASILISPDFWVPLGQSDLLTNDFFRDSGEKLTERRSHKLMLCGRRAPGSTLEDVNAELGVISVRLADAFPDANRDFIFTAGLVPRLGVSTAPENQAPDGIPSFLLSLSVAVLLIACLNLANMMLARGTARRKEIAIRQALGGTRAQIVRQFLAEGLILSLAGGALGLLIAVWGMSFLVATVVALVPFNVSLDVLPDAWVFAVTLLFCVLATAVFALGPALKTSRTELVSDLKEQGAEDRGSVVRGWRSLLAPRNLLVLGQVALSLVLLAIAALFVRSAFQATNAEPGFNAGASVIVQIDPSLVGYDEKRGRQIYTQLQQRLGALPGVEAVGVAGTVPFSEMALTRRVRAGGGVSPNEAPANTFFNVVNADYFKSLGILLRRGRGFSEAEMTAGEVASVAVIDESLAGKLFPDQDALGRYVEIVRGDAAVADGSFRIEKRRKEEATLNRPLLVVGIAPKIRRSIFDDGTAGLLYVPLGLEYQSTGHLHVRLALKPGSAEEEAILATIRREIRALDERIPVLRLMTLQQFFLASPDLGLVRATAALFSTFGLAALFLAAIGLYGVKSYLVSRRTREIGIRMALGATRRGVRWMILRQGVRLVGLGVALGLPLAILAGKLLSSALFQVSAFDPVVLLLVPLLLSAVAAVACWVPAVRATRINPVEALRAE